MLRSLPRSTVQTLSITKIPDGSSLSHPFRELVHLTISICTVQGLCEFFKCSPGLQYLHINKMSLFSRTVFDRPQLPDDQAVHLRRLAINDFRAGFDTLEALLQRTPNLKFLMICDDHSFDFLDAHRWHKLMRSSLPLLDVFKFIFIFDIGYKDDDIVEQLQLFQTILQHHRHHWNTEYVLSKDRTLIYTIPYMLNRYDVTEDSQRYYNQSVNDKNVFASVTDLTLSVAAVFNRDQYYFPNVKSLTLTKDCADGKQGYCFFKRKQIPSLKAMVNLCKLSHLEITGSCRCKSSSVIFQLMKEALHLSSLKLDKTILSQILKNRELCECLNKTIKKLDIRDFEIDTDLNSEEMVKLFQTFSNMEEFQCYIDQLDTLQVIKNQLSKLPYMKTFSYQKTRQTRRKKWYHDERLRLTVCHSSIGLDHWGYFNDDYSSDDNDVGYRKT